MQTMTRKAMGAGLVLALGFTSAACDDFLAVDNPNIVGADAINPEEDAPTFALSVQQNFAVAYGFLSAYSGWFAGEALVTETFPTRNEFGRRSIAASNSELNNQVWSPLALARASGDNLIHLLGVDETEAVTRASLFAGYSVLLMAELFCVGTISAAGNEPGPPLDTQQMLDAAIERFTRAIDIGTAVGTVEALRLASAARVGRARAHLQAGNHAQAIADAGAVPDGFTFNLNFIDDPGNRARLGNRLWIWTADRGSVGVAPAWRTGDPRVPTLSPDDHPYIAFETPAQSEFWIQQKFPTYASPMRVASKIEADYIAAEAGGTATQLALIQERRAANGLPAYDGPTDAQSVLTEFMDQRGFEFFLEVKRQGDHRRHPDHVRHVPPANSAYWKAGYGDIGSDVCWPLPQAETSNNPHFK